MNICLSQAPLLGPLSLLRQMQINPTGQDTTSSVSFVFTEDYAGTAAQASPSTGTAAQAGPSTGTAAQAGPSKTYSHCIFLPKLVSLYIIPYA